MRNTIALFLMSIFWALFLQVGAQNNKPDSIIHCGCDCTAYLYVKVTDKDGTEIVSLKKNDFEVYEDGVRQQIVVLERGSKNTDKDRPARYKIGYSPRNARFDGKYRRLKVSIKSGRYKVKTYPEGFHATIINKPCNDVVPGF